MDKDKKRYFIVRSNFNNGNVFMETPVETEGGKYPNRTILAKDLLDRVNKNVAKNNLKFEASQLFITSVDELSKDDYACWIE